MHRLQPLKISHSTAVFRYSNPAFYPNPSSATPIVILRYESRNPLKRPALPGVVNRRVGAPQPPPPSPACFSTYLSRLSLAGLSSIFSAYLCNKFASLLTQDLCGCWKQSWCPSQIVTSGLTPRLTMFAVSYLYFRPKLPNTALTGPTAL